MRLSVNTKYSFGAHDQCEMFLEKCPWQLAHDLLLLTFSKNAKLQGPRPWAPFQKLDCSSRRHCWNGSCRQSMLCSCENLWISLPDWSAAQTVALTDSAYAPAEDTARMPAIRIAKAIRTEVRFFFVEEAIAAK